MLISSALKLGSLKFVNGFTYQLIGPELQQQSETQTLSGVKMSNLHQDNSNSINWNIPISNEVQLNSSILATPQNYLQSSSCKISGSLFGIGV